MLLPEAEGWSKAIVLSPKPKGERQLFIEKAVVDLENIERDNNKSIDDKVLESLKQQAIEKVDALVYYPNKIQVFQKTVKFFIPQTFATEEQLKAENLHIMVMANNLRLRASQVWSDREQGSYVLPGKIGYPIDFVGFDARSDPLQPPVFDYVGTPQKQTSILSQFIIRQEGFSFIDYDNRNKQYNREKSTINESKKALTSSKVKEKPTLIPVKKEKISIEQRLIQLKDLYTKGLISEAEFQQLRSKILNEL
ncbi:MAG: SHOCT domain-containing protein [Pseudomonadota bacterium]